ncbi:endochitinase 1A, partial [Tanacetum coccineum]
ANDICKESKRQTINAEDKPVQGNKPSSHDVITGRWSPSAADRVGYNCGLFCFHMDSGNADRCKEELPPLYADLRDSSWQRVR